MGLTTDIPVLRTPTDYDSNMTDIPNAQQNFSADTCFDHGLWRLSLFFVSWNKLATSESLFCQQMSASKDDSDSNSLFNFIM